MDKFYSAVEDLDGWYFETTGEHLSGEVKNYLRGVLSSLNEVRYLDAMDTVKILIAYCTYNDNAVEILSTPYGVFELLLRYGGYWRNVTNYLKATYRDHRSAGAGIPEEPDWFAFREELEDDGYVFFPSIDGSGTYVFTP